jgi:2-polyprenyl-6-methoxyphenol hydroxylase-like FAD-dependent oxidoreductase
MKINKICILGGGTAGFSLACLLARFKEVSKVNLDITVVY